jgi:hypothetical protein
MAQVQSWRAFLSLSNQCVKRILNCDFYFFLADNADNICGLAWIFEAPTEDREIPRAP